jgi:hypothetical protein
VIEGNATINGDMAIDAAATGRLSALMFEGAVVNAVRSR